MTEKTKTKERKKERKNETTNKRITKGNFKLTNTTLHEAVNVTDCHTECIDT